MSAVEADDLERFDRAFFGHLPSRWRRPRALSGSASPVVGSTGACREARCAATAAPRPCGSAFALVSEAAMVTLGGELKRREAITGGSPTRSRGSTSGSAVVKRFHDAGEPRASGRSRRGRTSTHSRRSSARSRACCATCPRARSRGCSGCSLSRSGAASPDPTTRSARASPRRCSATSARATLLTAGIFIPSGDEAGLGRLEAALATVKPALEIEARLRSLVREKKLTVPDDGSLASEGLAAGLITQSDFERISAAIAARERAIAVDAFDPDEFRALRR
jgi:acyl-CoA dehydrogenase